MKETTGVQVELEGNALKLIIEEQAKYVSKKNFIGKGRLINILLAELYERRIMNTIVPALPMDKKQWKQYLKTK